MQNGRRPHPQRVRRIAAIVAAGGMLGVAIGAALGACAAAPANGLMSEVPAPAGATLDIVSDRFDSYDIALVRGGTRIVIGSVSGLRRRTMVIVPSQLGDGAHLQLAASRHGEPPCCLSQEFSARPGSTISWRLDAQVQSSLVVVK